MRKTTLWLGEFYTKLGKEKETAVEGEEERRVIDLKVGDTVTVGTMTWERIEGLAEDARTVPHFDTAFKNNLFNDETREVDVFRALLPIPKSKLLKIVRDNAEEETNRLTQWSGWHIDADLSIIFGGAQFKEGTDLWATQSVGLIPPPPGEFCIRANFAVFIKRATRGPRQAETKSLGTNRSLGDGV
jgi:hypothetical protein